MLPISFRALLTRFIPSLLGCAAGMALGFGSALHAGDPLNAPAVVVELGPEQIVAPGAGWPYLFQTAEGNTVALGHVKWLPKQPEPLVFTTRSFDGRKTWEPWQPSAAQGPGPITEGSVIQLTDGRILIFDVYAYHLGNQQFRGKRWTSADGWKTVTGPQPIDVTVPGIQTAGVVDDRGEPVSRLYLRRSVLQLPGGDLLATAYGRFQEDNTPVEYRPEMKQHRSYLIRSHDEGRTWAYVSTIAVPPAGQEGPGEPVLLQLKQGVHAGRLICQMRIGREHALVQTESDDEGKTWTPLRTLTWTYSRFGRTRELIGVDPDLIEMSDGTLVMSYGHKVDAMDNGNFLAFSVDQGATWTAETRINVSVTVAYTGVREVSPGTLFVVYTRTDETQNSAYSKARFDTMGRPVQVKRASP
ncbi:MAG: sialidase family protein [Opitutus sp.]